MTIQNYLQIQNNVVTNIIEWDGDTQTWTPPEDAIMKVKEKLNFTIKFLRFQTHLKIFTTIL